MRALALGVALFAAAGASVWSDHALAAEPRPNVVVVVTDDQTLASLSAATMPNVVSSIAGGGGTEFTNAIVTTPVCCPSRATVLTGQYAHNHGTLANTPGYGALRGKADTLPAWLRRRGYVTAHVGKYLNRYKAWVGDAGKVAPGWDEWRTVIDPARKYVRYYGYRFAVNGKVRRVGKRHRDYITRVINRNATGIVRRYAPKRAPLYLQVDHRAPHVEVGADSGGACGGLIPPDPRDAAAFQSEPLPHPPSFDETEIADKPSFIRSLPPIDSATESRIALRYRCALASLRSVDRGVGSIVRALRHARELSNTALIFTSDNGFFFGEHRIAEQKTRPYEEALRVPLVVRLPLALRGAGGPGAVGEPVANIDIAPTVLDLAGARPCRRRKRCRTMDGRSLVPLAGDRGAAGWPAERAIGFEFDAGERARRARVCRYEGVRVGGELYVEHTTIADPVTGDCHPARETERYDLAADPFQLDNLSPPGPGAPAAAELAARAAELQRCAGISGRDAPRPGRPYCE